MIKKVLIIMISIFMVGLAGCSSTVNDTENSEINIDESPSVDEKSATDEKPEHSDLYIEKYTLEDILSYFEEVVLRMEYSDGTGDVTCVQKWLSPIYYQLYGSYTDTDVSKLNELFTQLNNIDGFPGIYPATDTNYKNLTINFLETNELYKARIGYRTDIDILILKLLYNPKIELGMSYAGCAEIIKELYY